MENTRSENIENELRKLVTDYQRTPTPMIERTIVGILNDPVLNYMRHVARNCHEAEDLRQEAVWKFIRLLRCRFPLKHSCLTAYIFTIARNCYITCIRPKIIKRTTYYEHSFFVNQAALEDSVDDEVEDLVAFCEDELAHHMKACLDEKRRECFRQKIEGKTLAEIARTLAMNPQTVGTNIRRARQQMMKCSKDSPHRRVIMEDQWRYEMKRRMSL